MLRQVFPARYFKQGMHTAPEQTQSHLLHSLTHNELGDLNHKGTEYHVPFIYCDAHYINYGAVDMH